MKPSSLKKVFGIISYFPDNDSDYHTEMRRERSRRFKELLAKLEELWSDTDILVIAQNWQDFQLPEVKNKIITFQYNKLGILGARKELRKRFLESDYDYLIMLDDDAMVMATDPQAYMDEIDKHPNGVGGIRWINGPLQFFAISKHIYNQVEMPDVDAEKGQGFEDDVFANICRTKFPDACFSFPEGVVSENSLHYDGPGKCPSTYSRERDYNWDYMRSHTKHLIGLMDYPIDKELESKAAKHPFIDLIIPYVNCSDRNWIQDFIRTTKLHTPSQVRYRSWGTLKYLLRGVEKYMPFIRNVILIVSRQSQVPIWINQKTVRVVYHEDYIPKQFLPTFNSCTIESYLWNIPDLSDHIIYFNDDIFPINTMYVGDFFTGNTPHIGFREIESYSERNIFRTQCRSSIDLITKALQLPAFESGKIIRPHHIAVPMTKRSFDKVGELCKDTIPATISNMRLYKNVNQYIYAYYHYFTDDYINFPVEYMYFEVSDRTIHTILDTISDSTVPIICINDSDKMKDFAKTRTMLNRCFEKKFPDMSKYEIL